MDRVEAFVSDEAFYALEDIGQEAVNFMRERIMDRGTEFSSRAAAQGLNRGPGRIRTGAMYESVDYRDTSFGGGEIGSRLSIEFGYFNAPMAEGEGWEDVPYALMQENGFENLFKWHDPLTGPKAMRPYMSGGSRMTEGTHAFRDAKDYIRNYYRPIVATAASKAIARRARGA
jgi:hypothetical protein